MERKNRNREDITSIYVFDFDGTISDSPLPEDGKIRYEELTGKKYPHKGWWSKAESLLQEFDIQCHAEIVDDYMEVMKDPDGLVVMLTNRMKHLKDPIFSILHRQNLQFDACSFKYDGRSKLDRVLDIMDQYPRVDRFEAWEDMREHIADLVRVFELRPMVSSVIHFVGDDRADKNRSGWANITTTQDYLDFSGDKK